MPPACWPRGTLAAGLLLLGTQAAAAPPALLAFIDAALDEGRVEQARQLIDNARALGDPSPGLDLRAAELALVEDPQAAQAALAALADGPVAADALALLARLALLDGDPARAAALADRALARDRDSARAWMARAVCADHARDWTLAGAAHAAAVRLAPRSAMARNNRGWSQLLQGHHAAAEADFRAALELAPARARIRRNLMMAIALDGRYAEALAMGSALTRGQDLNLVGAAALARGEGDRAAAYFSRARDTGGPEAATAEANLALLAQGSPRR